MCINKKGDRYQSEERKRSRGSCIRGGSNVSFLWIVLFMSADYSCDKEILRLLSVEIMNNNVRVYFWNLISGLGFLRYLKK